MRRVTDVTSGRSAFVLRHVRHATLPSLAWGSPLIAGPLAVLLGAGLGVAVALSSPLAAMAAAAGAIAAMAVAARLRIGLLALILVVSLLPFAVIPVRIGFQLTMVDALLGAVLIGWLVRCGLGKAPLELGAAGRPLVLYVGLAVAALLAGTAYAPVSGAAVRGFVKYAAAILLMLPVANVVRSRDQVRALVRALIVGGALAAVLGLVIHALPRAQIVQVLSSLSGVGYPSGSAVLRFLPGPNNTYSDTVRATGTSIDPNVFGGLLMLAAALMLAQWFAPRPVVARWALVPLLGVTVAAMLASHSRSSWVGLAVAGAFLATFRYRKLWLLAVPIMLVLVYVPAGQELLERLQSGFTARDRAAALRLDEYRQALRLIAAYPVLGVGFGGAPELGTFVGVSSIYLLVGEQTGLLGLACYLVSLATLVLGSIRVRSSAVSEDQGLVSTLQAPVVAALTAGLFDHYFMNPQFPHMVALFWLYAGLLVAATRLAGRPQDR